MTCGQLFLCLRHRVGLARLASYFSAEKSNQKLSTRDESLHQAPMLGILPRKNKHPGDLTSKYNICIHSVSISNGSIGNHMSGIMSFLLPFIGGAAAATTGPFFKQTAINFANRRSKVVERSESIKAAHQLRFASLDRRLEAHQKAFSLCRHFAALLKEDEARKEMIGICDKWWGENSLYLEPDAREAFLRAVIALRDYPLCGDNDVRIEHNRNINDAPEIIQKAVSLPPIKKDISAR
ncbi:hypothetical protein [Dongshaea marina]|uniref:hypothetical protein n=1 Tax=Dongshaea marina TaxID=2047966 RepID=UPI000D3E1822|nr:hypothetical protein [Dongshaea marina]